MKKILFQILLLVLALPAGAQEYTFRKYVSADGLSSSRTLAIFQDSRGFMWYGTDAGLSRFDGHTFVNYSTADGLPFNVVTAIAEDSKGHIWFTSGKGFSSFDGEKFTNYTHYQQKAIGTARDIAILAHDEVLVGSGSGLFLLSKDTLRKFDTRDGLTGNSVFSIEKLRNGDALIGTNGGITRYSKGRLGVFWQEKEARVLGICEDRAGGIWFGLLHSDLKYYNGSTFVSIPYPGKDSFFITSKMCLDAKGRVLVAHEASLSVFEQGRFVKEIGNFLEIRSDAVNTLYADRENNYWIGSIHGLWKCSPSISRNFLCDNVYCFNSIYAIQFMPAAKHILFSDGKNLLKIAGDSLQKVFTDKPHQLGEISSINQATDGSTLFSSSLGGIVSFHPQRGYTVFPQTADFGEARIFCGETAPDSSLLFGASGKIWQYKDRQLHEYLVLRDSTPKNILSIGYDRYQRLWFGTFSSLFMVEQNRVTDYTGLLDSLSIVVNQILPDAAGNLWISTKGFGLLKISFDAQRKPYIAQHLHKKNGLRTDFIAAISWDGDGNLWVATFNGLIRLQQPLRSNAPVLEYLSEENGLLKSSWGFARFTTDDQGRVWLGCSEGIMRLQPENRYAGDITSVHITQVILDRGEIPWEDAGKNSFFGYPAALLMDYRQHAITFHFTAINFANPGMLFSYKLEGFDRDWSVPSVERKVVFNNLKPGKYRFRVKAIVKHTTGDQPEAVYDFEIRKPFWQETWFLFLAGFAFIGSFVAFYRWRISLNNRKQNEKILVNRQLSESRFMAFQARMNPHFIFNSLNAIQYFITRNDKHSSLLYLSKFARLLRQVLDNSKELKIPLAEEIAIIRTYIEMEALRFEHKFSFDLQVDPGLDINNTEIPGMLLQPFVENAIVHGLLHKTTEDGLLLIRMKKGQQCVICEIEDNGVGRQRSFEINNKRQPNHKSHGTEIAINRLRLITEDLGISNPVEIVDLDTGTRIILYLPTS